MHSHWPGLENVGTLPEARPGVKVNTRRVDVAPPGLDFVHCVPSADALG